MRTQGDWDGWFDFFFEGVRESAGSAVSTAQRLIRLFDADRDKLQSSGRLAGNVLRVHGELKRKVIVSIPSLAKELKIAVPTATRAIDHLIEAGIVREISGRKRDRMWAYDEYLNVLHEGTEPLST